MSLQRKNWFAAAIASVLISTTSPVCIGGGQAVYRFDLPAQPLADALRAIARQTGTNVLFESKDINGIRTAELKGDLTAVEAIEQLLAGTKLHAEGTTPTTVIVQPVSALPVGAARMTQPGVSRLAQSDASPASATEDAKADSSSLQEIIVTAQKRQERLTDVPLSIDVLTAEEINRRGLVSAEDYLRGIPGVNQVPGTYGAIIIVRGIETGSVNLTSGSTVASYFGESSTTATGTLVGATNIDLKLVDIERVEVLRGPQGTAFGSASLGGAVRTIPVAPKLDRFEGKVATNYSVTDGTGSGNHMIQAVANIPLIQDKLAIRATAYRFNDSGFYESVAGSNADFQAYASLFGAQSRTADKKEIGAARSTGGRVAALFHASDDLRLTLSFLSQKGEQDGMARAGTDGVVPEGTANFGAYDQSMFLVAPEQVLRGEEFGVFDSKIDLANATLEYGLGWGDLLATFSHIESRAIAGQPFAGLPLSELGRGRHNENSGELRLTTSLDGPWNFLAGLYAEQHDDRGYYNYFWSGSLETAAAFFNSPTLFLGDYLAERDLRQKAAFAEVSWELLPKLTLTGGARSYDFDRTEQLDTTGILGLQSRGTRLEASGTSFRGNLSYKLRDDALVYAAFSQGFRLGKPQAGLPAGICDRDNDGIVDATSNVTIASTQFLDSDTVDSYELGAKIALLDRRLSIAADIYRIDWVQLPFGVNAPSFADGGCGLSYSANAGAASSHGVELQLDFQVNEALRIGLGGSVVQAELTQDVPNLPVPALDGNRLPESPELNANFGVQYSFNIGGYPAFVRTDSIYVGSFYSRVPEAIDGRAGEYVKVDLTARLVLNNLNIDLFARNLTNDDAFTTRSYGVGEHFGHRMRPRTVGLQLEYNF